MNRRGFLSGILAAAVAPAIIRTPGILMPVRKIVMPEGSGKILTATDVIDFQTAYREEFLKAFHQHQKLLIEAVTSTALYGSSMILKDKRGLITRVFKPEEMFA